jgi:short-subunit dehydrogenase
VELNGKTAVLTGAAGGIGSAMAEALAGAGVRLVLVGRNAPARQGGAARRGGQHLTVTADLATDEGRQRVQQCCAALPDGIDILINNAGISAFGSFDAQTPALLTELLTTNLLAPMLLTGQLLALLRQAPRGLIINVGSAFGAIGHPGFAGYSASKFALRGFREALRR